MSLHENIVVWADVASSMMGAPPGFKLFRYSPLGWSPRKAGPLVQLSTTPSFPKTRMQELIQWSCPVVWFSLYTPCLREYELKFCRRILTTSTIEAVDRTYRRQQNAGPNSRRRDRGQDSAETVLSETTKQQVEKLAYSMASDQRLWMLRIVSYVATKLFFWFFGRDLYIEESGVEYVRALQKTHSLIYIPTHKSHLDSVLMGYVMFANGLEPAHIVAGDNLRLPLLSYIMRSSGALFIRRTNKDVKDRDLYKKALAGFVEGLLSHGKHLEFFIEGGRSRDGCILDPKLGILAHVVDAFIDADLPKDGNVAVVPVSITYDHPLEENALLTELMGHSKKPETLWSFISSLGRVLLQCWKRPFSIPGVGGRCGCATVAFGKPLHLKMLLRTLSRGVKGHRVSSLRSPSFRGMLSQQNSINRNDLIKAAFPLKSDERYRAVQVIGTAVHTQLRNIQIVPASSLLYCAIFLQAFQRTSFPRTLDLDEIMDSVERLQRMLKRNGGRFMSFPIESRKSSMQRIQHFIPRFRKWIVEKEDGFTIRPAVSSLLMFYIRSNHLLVKLSPICLVTSAVIGCIQGFGQNRDLSSNEFKTSTAPRQGDFISVPFARRTAIITATLWLREILSPELDLVFGEKGFRTQAEIQDYLDKMVSDGLLELCIPSAPVSRRLSSSVNSSILSCGRRRSVDHVVDKLILDVVGDMEVRGRASMQFESDLRKCKDDSECGYVPTLSRIQSSDTPTQRIEEDIFQSMTDSVTPRIAEYITPGYGSEVYALVYSPLIATYEFLFGQMWNLFELQDYYEEKSLNKRLLEGLCSVWNSTGDHKPHDNLCWNPIPCQTIVQRFVNSLKTWKSPKKDFPFSPYPMLMSGSTMMPSSRPPRPSLSSDCLNKKVFSEATGSVVSDTDASEVANLERSVSGQVQLRREFREGKGIVDYQEKLSLFIPSQDHCFV